MPLVKIGARAISKAPSAPDPYQTSAAQTASNLATAKGQLALNAPLGNVTNAYGSNTVQTDANGLPIGQTSTLSTPLQTLLSQREGLGSAIQGAQGALASSLPTGGLNLNFGNAVNDAAKAAYGAQTNFLNPQFAIQTKQLNQQLDDRGLPIGSEARNDATTLNQNNQNLALTQAANNAYGAGLNAQQQGFGQSVTQNQLPYADLASLTASNPTATLLANAPGAANLPGASVQPTNVSQNVQNAYQDQLAANQYNSGQLASGILGLGTLGLAPLTGGATGGLSNTLFGTAASRLFS